MAATMKGAISFGLLHVPISLHTATQDNDIRFNQLCREDGSRVKYKKVCAKCGKEVSAQDIIKGFEIEPGHYVTLTDEDFEKAKVRKDKTIHILHFANIHDIRPIYVLFTVSLPKRSSPSKTGRPHRRDRVPPEASCSGNG